MLHRDVKPHNVLLADDGRVVLSDFGLASVEGTGPEPSLGTPHYLAPERVRGGEAGPAADLWSLGATLYAAVEGRSPVARESILGSLSAVDRRESYVTVQLPPVSAPPVAVATNPWKAGRR